MKSTEKELQKRGFATPQDIDLLRVKSENELLELLHSSNAVLRTAATINLTVTLENGKQLLDQLSVEKCLYTKISICEKLEQGNAETASQMINYLGKIGKNQQTQLPKRVSMKKSFPLPRDLIARSLARMSITIFPLLLQVLQSKDIEKISEVLDAIGFMVFYNQQLSTEHNAQIIYTTLLNYKEIPLIQWKSILCLSAFPLESNKSILESFIVQSNLLGEEALRSLNFINRSKKISILYPQKSG